MIYTSQAASNFYHSDHYSYRKIFCVGCGAHRAGPTGLVKPDQSATHQPDSLNHIGDSLETFQTVGSLDSNLVLRFTHKVLYCRMLFTNHWMLIDEEKNSGSFGCCWLLKSLEFANQQISDLEFTLAWFWIQSAYIIWGCLHFRFLVIFCLYI